MQSLIELSEKQLSLDKGYLVSPFGLGDTAILCGLKNQIEIRYSMPIAMVIKKSHEVVCDMYDIKDYILCSGLDDGKSTKSLEEIAVEVASPSRGRLFVAHYDWHLKKELLHIQDGNIYFSFLDFYKGFLDLPWDCKFEYPKPYFTKMVDILNIAKKLQESGIVAPINELALLVPEARTFKPIELSFWEGFAKDFKSEGLTPITSVTNECFMLKGIPNLKLSLNELICLAMNCRIVVVMRSGLCDLIWQKGKSLYVVYSDLRTYYFARLKSIFPTSNVNEVIISNL